MSADRITERPIPITALEAKLGRLQKIDQILETIGQTAGDLPVPVLPVNPITEYLSQALQAAYERAQKKVGVVAIGRERLKGWTDKLTVLIETEKGLPEIRYSLQVYTSARLLNPQAAEIFEAGLVKARQEIEPLFPLPKPKPEQPALSPRAVLDIQEDERRVRIISSRGEFIGTGIKGRQLAELARIAQAGGRVTRKGVIELIPEGLKDREVTAMKYLADNLRRLEGLGIKPEFITAPHRGHPKLVAVVFPAVQADEQAQDTREKTTASRLLFSEEGDVLTVRGISFTGEEAQIVKVLITNTYGKTVEGGQPAEYPQRAIGDIVQAAAEAQGRTIDPDTRDNRTSYLVDRIRAGLAKANLSLLSERRGKGRALRIEELAESEKKQRPVNRAELRALRLFLDKPGVDSRELLVAFGQTPGKSNQYDEKVQNLLSAAVTKLNIAESARTEEEDGLLKQILASEEHRKRLGLRFRLPVVQAARVESTAVGDALPVNTSPTLDVLPAGVTGLPAEVAGILFRGESLLSAEEITTIANILRVPLRGGQRLAERVTSRFESKYSVILGSNFTAVANFVRRRLGNSPLGGLGAFLSNPADTASIAKVQRRLEREEERLRKLRAVISEVTDLLDKYNVGPTMHTNQLKAIPEISIHPKSIDHAVKAGWIGYYSSGSNAHNEIRREELGLMILIFRRGKRDMSENEKTEVQKLFREEFHRRKAQREQQITAGK